MTENSTGLVAAPPRPPETPEEREATFRVAKALAESGFYKDARQPGQALAKILTGRDLGLSATESMGAFYVVNGKVEAVGDFHATRVRSTPGYDYDVEFSEDDEGETDGCKITLFGPKRGKEYEQLGVSTFTRKDAERARLQDKDTYKQFPRNMYFNRAISNGVAWFCPEVMGAVRVYSPGEVEDMAPPVGEAAPEMSRGDLGVSLIANGLPDEWAQAVCNTVRRAQKLGHAGHGNAATVEMLLRGQPESKVKAWLIATNNDLEALIEAQREPEDAQVVEDGDDGEPVPGPDLSPDALRKMAADHRAEAASMLAEDPIADNAEDVAHQLRDEAAQLEAHAREMDGGLDPDSDEALEQQDALEGVE